MRAFLLVLPLAFAACGDKEAADDTASGGYDPTLTGDAAAGEATYSGVCASCHGASGEGGFGPAMTDEVPEKTDEQIWGYVRDGIESEGMPAYDTATISQQELADLIAYLRATFDA